MSAEEFEEVFNYISPGTERRKTSFLACITAEGRLGLCLK
jgi:hypothetical protein